ncbi:MAG: SusC/RagA family TonB-linked outer membrane protein [Fulvivirga sp.]
MKKILLLFTILLVSYGGLLAQRTITGKATDANDGNALPGVNIMEQATTNGTVTDIDGNYSLSVTNDDAVLIFSFIGYANQEVAVGSRDVINVALEQDVTELTEVVVIGYGEIEARDATGAVASVKAEDFNKGMISSPEQLIQGKTAGVQITSASGEPGAGVNIRIRGTSSVRSGNEPLFVVDGVPLSGSETATGGPDLGRGTSTAKNPLNFINPSDIASIDILKDASATAIYGSRGANGVVIITTKGGKGASNAVEYSSTLSISETANRFDLLNREQFLAGVEGLGGDAASLDEGASTDWQDEIFRTSVSHNHNISYANAFNTGNYRASISYDNQKGVVENSGMKRYTARLNYNQRLLNDKLNIGLQATLSRVNDEAAPITDNAGFEGDLLGATYMANPTWVADPDIQVSSTIANPLSLLKYTQDKTEADRSLINVSVDYDITEGLNFKINTGFDNSSSVREVAYSPALFIGNVFENGRGYIGEVESDNTLLEAFFNYEKTFGNAELTALLGYSYQEFKRSGIHINGWGFDDPAMDVMVDNLNSSSGAIMDAIDIPYQQFGYDAEDFFVNSLFPEPATIDIDQTPTTSVNSVTGDKYATIDELQSFFGRLNYNLNEKYLFTATFRADGSTKFGGDNRYGFFPSGAFAWRLSEEAFIPEVFYDLKFRLGYGVTGNQEIPHNLHQARQRYNAIGIDNGGNVSVPGLGTVAFDNSNLKWEQTSQVNIGLDFSLGTGRLNGTIDYYRKITTDLLILVTSAQPAPQPFTWQNLDAEVVNNGVELTLNYFLIDRTDFDLDLGFNLAYNENEVQNYKGIIDTGAISGQGLSRAFAQRIVGGRPLYAYFIRKFEGYDENGLSIYNEDVQEFVDKSPLPTTNLGFSLNAAYKNFDFSAYLNGQFGFYVYNNTANAFFTKGSLGNGRNVTTDVLNSEESQVNAPDASTRFLEKGDFLRMQTLALGYNFDLEDGGFIKALRLSANAQNLFVITDYSGLDPEVNVNKALDDVPSLGIDYTAYPRARTYSIGLSARF